jgi:hypothetical protein
VGWIGVLAGVCLAASAWGTALPASAAACCEMDAVIDGDGLAAPLELDTEDLVDLELGLTDFGFFVEPPIGDGRPGLTQTAPTSSLGSGFTVTWTFGGQGEVVQDLYPYAVGGPLVHTEPGQLFSEVPQAQVRGGWFRAGPQLVTGLRSVGLPERAQPTGDPGSRWPLLAGLLAAVVLAGTATTVGARRRLRHRPA